MGHAYRARDLLADRKVIIDTTVPPIVFVSLAGWLGLRVAAAGSLCLCALLVAIRVVRRQRLLFTFSGLTGVLVGVAVALWSGGVQGFFAPDIVISAAAGVVCVVSILVKRPLIALTSAAVYRWPLAWYWQDNVRPAYSEITWAWAALYLTRAAAQGVLAARGAVGRLTVVHILTGWPAFAVLLVATYAYINRRLNRLGAPTVEQWRARHHESPPSTVGPTREHR